MSKAVVKQDLKTEALKLALEALNRNDYLGWQTNIHVRQAIREALMSVPDGAHASTEREQPAPSELTTISEDECLLDVDESAWRRLVEQRGGCRCHLSPPCAACSEPVTEAELNDVGYTYEQPAQQQQEPVAEVLNERGEVDWISFVPIAGTPLYTSPQSKSWVPLTEFDIDQIPYSCSHADSRLIAYAIEAKLREKNA